MGSVEQETKAMHNGLRTLAELPVGGSAELVEVRAGHALRGRLSAMGLHRGVVLRMARNARRGPLIIDVNGNRMALGRGMAEKIVVRLQAEGVSSGGATGGPHRSSGGSPDPAAPAKLP